MPHTAKDTRAMESARYKNKNQETYLNKKIESLELEHKIQALKIHSSVGELHELLTDINPYSSKSIIYPKGLSEEQKRTYRELRKGNVPSMSLDEFDFKIAMLKKAKEESASEDDIIEPIHPIINMKSHAFCAPIPKNKHTVREAFKRLNSSDVKYTSDPRHEILNLSHTTGSTGSVASFRSGPRGRLASLSSNSSVQSNSSSSTESGTVNRSLGRTNEHVDYFQRPVAYSRSRSIGGDEHWTVKGTAMKRERRNRYSSPSMYLHGSSREDVFHDDRV